MSAEGRAGWRSFGIPLPRERMAVMHVPYGLTERDVDLCLAYLRVLEAAISGGPIPGMPAPLPHQSSDEEPREREQPAAAEGGSE